MGDTKVESSNINMLNALRDRMSISYQDRIPEATENNIANIDIFRTWFCYGCFFGKGKIDNSGTFIGSWFRSWLCFV